MTAQIQTNQVWELLLQLPKSEQKKLLLRLVSHVVDEPEEEEAFKLSPEWEAEIERRIKRIESGEAEAVPVEKVFAKYGL